MASRHRSMLASSLVLLAALAPAASAGAAVRLAAPDGSGSSPCNPTPCSLSTAIGGAAGGDQVVLAPGTYTQPTSVVVSQAIDVGGQPGAVPTVGLVGVQFELRNAGAMLHDVRLTLTEFAMARPLVIAAGNAERVYADPAGKGGEGCVLEAGTLRDSVCVEGLSVFGSNAGQIHATVANVTANPLLVGAFGGAALSVDVLNTIAVPASGPFVDPHALLIDVSDGSSAAVTLRNSSYASVGTSLSSGTNYTFTAPGTNGNQTAPPQFVDAAAGDFRQLSSSPTVDAGLSDPLIGAADVLGAARVQPRCIGGPAVPDIGAYELTPTAPCSETIGKPRPSLRLGKVKLNKRKGTAVLPATVSAAGNLVLTGKGLTRRAKAGRPQTVKLRIKAKGRKLSRLRSSGAVPVKAKVTFRPTGGAPVVATRKLKLKLVPAARGAAGRR